jgi:hypothetical protein
MNATFNPASFAPAAARPTVVSAIAPATRQVHDLRAAAKLFALRGQTRNADTCLDMATKLERFGSFVSDKQADYAAMLVGWATADAPKNPPLPASAAPARAQLAPAPVVALPALFALMQRLSKLTIGDITIARKNQDSLCWVKVVGRDGVVGKIENGVLALFKARLVIGTEAGLIEALRLIEADPEMAAVLHGKASGRCAVCSRDLTDETSIARGVGPVCIQKAGW